MVKKFLVFTLFLLLPFAHPLPALAVCPVCTVAVGAGLGLSRWLGIDDTISGIWIGGLILSMSFWLIDWLKKKDFKNLKQFKESAIYYSTIVLMYVLTLFPLWYGDIIGVEYNTILGIDKILFGTTIGSLVFIFGKWADKKVREIKGRQLFQYQKVAFPVSSLIIVSLLIYYFGGYLYRL